jgi:hypothetical protein
MSLFSVLGPYKGKGCSNKFKAGTISVEISIVKNIVEAHPAPGPSACTPTHPFPHRIHIFPADYRLFDYMVIFIL